MDFFLKLWWESSSQYLKKLEPSNSPVGAEGDFTPNDEQ